MNVLEYFATPGAMTFPGGYAALFDCLPSEIGSLCRVVQGLMIHLLARTYAQLPKPRLDEVQLRSVAAKLARIGELDPRPLTEARASTTPGRQPSRLLGDARFNPALSGNPGAGTLRFRALFPF